MTDIRAELETIHAELADIQAGLAAVAVRVLALSLMVDDSFVDKPLPPITKGILNVQYLSQWDRPDADDRPGDCGPACVAMLARFLTTSNPTVDEAATACGQPTTGRGKWTTGFNHLETGAKFYGITLDYRRPLDIVTLCDFIDDGKPSIALINYGVLGEYLDNQDTYEGGHWVLVVGYDGENIIIHDPDWKDDRRAEGAFRHIPRTVYDLAAGTPKKGYFSKGWQGLVVT